MALPSSRDFDAVDAGPLPAATVNNLQDAVVGGKHGEKTLLLAGSMLSDGSGANPIDWVDGIVLGHTSGTSIANAPIPLCAGDRIKTIKVYIDDGASSAFTVTYYVLDLTSSAGTPVLDSDSDTSSGGGGQEVVELDGINYTLTATGAAYVKINIPTGNNNRIKGVTVLYDRP